MHIAVRAYRWWAQQNQSISYCLSLRGYCVVNRKSKCEIPYHQAVELKKTSSKSLLDWLVDGEKNWSCGAVGPFDGPPTDEGGLGGK
jgi:hypothetical protein